MRLHINKLKQMTREPSLLLRKLKEILNCSHLSQYSLSSLSLNSSSNTESERISIKSCSMQAENGILTQLCNLSASRFGNYLLKYFVIQAGDLLLAHIFQLYVKQYFL